jgi:hypothetical protein
VGAIDRLRDDEARTALTDPVTQVLHVVVAERDRIGAGAQDALAERCVGHHVEVHRDARTGDALDQAGVRGEARLAQHDRRMAQESRHFGLQALLRAALLEHRRHQGPAVMRVQGCRLGRRQLRGGAEVEIVVAVEADGARPGLATAKEVSSAPVLSDPAEIDHLHAAGYELR